MAASGSCPDIERLRALLAGDVSPEEEAALAEHLAECERCRRVLENTAAPKAWLPQDKDWTATSHAGRSDALQGAMDRLLSAAGGGYAEGFDAEDAEGEPRLPFLTGEARDGFLGRFDRYDIASVLGQGGMGVVLQGRDPLLNRTVAIKVLAPGLAADPSARLRFLREAQTAAAVDHDHLVTIHTVAEAQDLPYLVMEYIEGPSLDERIVQAAPLPADEVVQIGAQVAAGLAAAHAKGLVHRDIKPANILLDCRTGRAKIVDFGLAKAALDVSVTRTGTFAGTPQYMAPEQARGGTVDHRTDLYSFGGVLWSMCTARPPVMGTTLASVVHELCERPPTPICQVNPDVPAWLGAIIDRLRAPDPDDRFQSTAEVCALLAEHLPPELRPSSSVWRAAPPAESSAEAPSSAEQTIEDGSPFRPHAHVPKRDPYGTLRCVGEPPASQDPHTVPSSPTPPPSELTETDVRDSRTMAGAPASSPTQPAAHSHRRMVLVVAAAALALLAGGLGLAEMLGVTHLGQYLSRRGGDENAADTPVATGAGPAGGTPAVADPAKSDFVVYRGTKARRGFADLAAAVAAAEAGETIEIRRDGLVEAREIILSRPITIRPARGKRPLFRANLQAGACFRAEAAAVLEGLDFEYSVGARPAGGKRPTLSGRDATGMMGGLLPDVIVADRAPLMLAHCRFTARGSATPVSVGCVSALGSPMCEIRNCFLLGLGGHAVRWACGDGNRLTIRNCIALGGTAVNVVTGARRGALLRLTRNTLGGKEVLFVTVVKAGRPRRPGLPRLPGVGIDAQGNHFESRLIVTAPAPMSRGLADLMRWRDEGNRYAAMVGFIGEYNSRMRLARVAKPTVTDLAGWNKFWGRADPKTTTTAFTLADKLGTKLRSDPTALTPEDFRLPTKDAGADVDTVGPGAAYERWRDSAEYRSWREAVQRMQDRRPGPP